MTSKRLFPMQFACCILILTTFSSFADETVPETSKEPYMIDRVYRGVTDRTLSTARWLDSFFGILDSNAEYNHSKLEFRQIFDASQLNDVNYRSRFSLKLNLPNFSKRLNLIVSDSRPEDELNQQAELDDSLNQVEDDSLFGIEYFSMQSQRKNLRFDAGYRTGNRSLYVGSRYRFEKALTETWISRFTQLLRYYARDGWHSRSNLHLYYPFKRSMFFRQNIIVDWLEAEREERGTRTELISAFTRIHDDNMAYRLQLTSIYDNQPTSDWQSSTLSFAFRKRLWRPWFFIELRPYVAFEQIHNWRDNPGITLTFTVNFRETYLKRI